MENIEKTRWSRLVRDSRGATMVEYIVLITLILLVAVKAWRELGTQVSTKTNQAKDELTR